MNTSNSDRPVLTSGDAYELERGKYRKSLTYTIGSFVSLVAIAFASAKYVNEQIDRSHFLKQPARPAIVQQLELAREAKKRLVDQLKIIKAETKPYEEGKLVTLLQEVNAPTIAHLEAKVVAVNEDLATMTTTKDYQRFQLAKRMHQESEEMFSRGKAELSSYATRVFWGAIASAFAFLVGIGQKVNYHEKRSDKLGAEAFPNTA